MRVVTFNAEHARVPGADRSDPARLAEALATLEPDVVALQEVDRGDRASGGVDQPGAVAAALGGTTVFAPRRAGGTTGVALVAREPIVDVAVRRFATRGSPRRGRRVVLPRLCPSWRVALLGRVTVDGREVSVATAHLDLVRAVSHLQLERVVAALAALPGPHVLLGDLNRPRRWVAPTAAAVGLTLLDDDTPTHPASDPVRRIDHVATSGLEVVRSSVEQLPVGDHRAVVVDLQRTGDDA